MCLRICLKFSKAGRLDLFLRMIRRGAVCLPDQTYNMRIKRNNLYISGADELLKKHLMFVTTFADLIFFYFLLISEYATQNNHPRLGQGQHHLRS